MEALRPIREFSRIISLITAPSSMMEFRMMELLISQLDETDA
jgi:hypothetical protein